MKEGVGEKTQKIDCTVSWREKSIEKNGGMSNGGVVYDKKNR